MFKEFIGSLFGFDKQILSLETQLYNLQKDCVRFDNLAKNAEKEIAYFKSEREQYDERIAGLLDKLKPVNVPNADITYQRPVLIGNKEFGFADVDVRLFIQPDFLIEKAVKKANLGFDGSQDLDELIPLVYRLARKNYKYGSDSHYGFSEYWMFPFELRYVRSKKLAGDCDDHSNWIASYFEAAKIPCTKWLVSCGTTRSGFGHSTIYCKDSDGEWRHLNSTAPSFSFDSLKKFPSNKDEKDLVGIKPDGFWFSYNKSYSLHSFESAEAKDSFFKQKLPISIKSNGFSCEYLNTNKQVDLKKTGELYGG